MKKKNSIFTKSKMGLDYNVWISMLIVLIVSGFFLSFKAITSVNCSLEEISTAGLRQQTNNIFYVGETVTFSIPYQSNNQFKWNFDDGSPVQNGGKIMQHNFLREGSFNVTCLMTNSKCEQSVYVNIISTPSKPKDTATLTNPIIGMDTTYVGTAVHYSTLIKANYNYQWSISSSPDIQTTQGADFTFYKDGPQLLTLKIDGTKNYTKTIAVLPRKSSVTTNNTGDAVNPSIRPMAIPPAVSFILPSTGGPGTNVTISGSFFGGTKFVSFGGVEAKIISVNSTQIVAQVGEGATGNVVVTTDNGTFTFSNPPFTYIAPLKPAQLPSSAQTKSENTKPENVKISITDKQLKAMLQQVVSNSMHAEDFDRYFCSGVNTKVYINNEKVPVTFTVLCQQQLQGKKVEIESAHIVADPDNPRCETNLVVKYKKTSGFLKKIF